MPYLLIYIYILSMGFFPRPFWITFMEEALEQNSLQLKASKSCRNLNVAGLPAKSRIPSEFEALSNYLMRRTMMNQWI